MLGQIKANCGCYKIVKNGSLHIHTLLLFNDSPNPNKLIQMLHDNKNFWENMINYFNDIITWYINMFKLFDPKILEIHDKHDDCLHPCTTRPPNTHENTFHVLFNNDMCKVMNVSCV